MARPIWKGAITLGLINVPVSLMPAERKTDLKFSLLDSRDRAKIRYQRVNETTGEEVPWDQIAKGYELDGDHYVLLTPEDFEKADAGTSDSIAIEDFVKLDEIGLLYYDKPYYLTPGKAGRKGYVLLREALSRAGKAGVARIVIRKKEHLAALIPYGSALILMILRFHQELRPMADYDFPGDDVKEYRISDKEMDMAVNLVESMSVEWEPEKYQNEYREALLAWINEKAESAEVPETPSKKKAAKQGDVIDMMDLLKKSVEQTQKERGTAKGKGKKKSTGAKKSSQKKASGS
ncbi:MAG: Ku protein [Desulfococcaceae bacterium]